MKTSTVIRDKISGAPFAVLISTNGGVRAFGATGQGRAWAEWAGKQPSHDSLISSLDATLVAERDVEMTTELMDSFSSSFDQQILNDMRTLAAEKALLLILNTKTDTGSDGEKYEQMNDVSEEEEIRNWPITDAALATIDVAYKQIAINYKARAFALDTKRAGILLQVKGVRAIWDPNMPGGGGWRCPDDTPNGGQFTNRLGRGCTFGAMRRIGRSLVAASLRDITRGIDDAANIDMPSVNRAGRAILRGADTRDARLQEKFKNRAERRARRLAKDQAKRQLRDGAITWRQAYQSLGEDRTRRGRARIATALVAKRIADDAAAAAFVAENRRGRRRAARRAGRVVEKTPPPITSDTGTPGAQQQTGPSRREILAERLRQAAEGLVSEDPLAGRRMSRRTRGRVDVGSPSVEEDEYVAPKSPLRQSRGESPKPTSIASRFARGKNRTRMSEIQAIRREMRGRTPRSTTPLRERISMRMRRRAAYMAGEMPGLANYPQYEQSRVNLPDIPGGKLDGNAFFGRGASSNKIDAILRNIPGPPGSGESSFIPDGDTPAREEFVRNTRAWLSDETVEKGLNELQKFFTHRYGHSDIRTEVRAKDKNDPKQVRDALARAANFLDPFDSESQDDLKSIYEDWQRDFNDPMQPVPDGYVSNLGKTITRQDEDENGAARTILYATDIPSKPVVYIEDSDNGIAHLLNKEGRHVLSMYTDDEGTVRFIAGSAAAEKIAKEGMRKPLRERLAPLRQRILRSDARGADAEPMSLRARRIAVERSKTRSGLSFGKTTSGDDYFPLQWGSREDLARDHELIDANIKQQLEKYDESFRRRLNIADPDEPLSEDAMLDYINDIAKTDSRQAGILKTRLHDFIVMSEIEQSGDYQLINNLKPSARQRVLEGASNLTRRSRSGRYSYTPRTASKKKQTNIEDIVAPIVVNEPFNGVAPAQTPVTGPTLTAGLGNPSLGIEYDKTTGLYRDIATGLYVEDLSGLQLGRPELYKAQVFEDMDPDSYPVVRVSPPGILPPRYVRLAPGTDPDGAGKVDGTNITGIARNHNEALELFATATLASSKPGTAQGAVDRILGIARQRLLDNQTTRVDATNAMSSAYPDPTVTSPSVTAVKQFSIGELLTLGRSSSADSDIFSLPNIPEWLGATDGSLDEKISNDSSMIQVLNNLGIDPDLPIGEFYLSAAGVTDHVTGTVIRDLNKALQQQHVQSIAHNFGVNQTPDTDLKMFDMWVRASAALESALGLAEADKRLAMDELKLNKRNKQQQGKLLKAGHEIELYKNLIERHIIGNPVALKALEEHKRSQLQNQASAKNARIIAAQARAARGIKASGAFDDQPDILDPWGSANPPAAPRSLDDILAVHAQQKAEGLFENPAVSGITQLSDEQVTVLSAMGELHAMGRSGQLVGLPGTPYDGISFDNITKAMLAHMWHYNGHNSLPVLATKEEMLAASAGALTPEGTQPAFFISRGVQGSPASQVQFVSDLLTGDRFIPGQGGQVAGLGDYWSLGPGRWASYHGGNGGTAIAVITPQMRVVSRDAHLQIFNTSNGAPLYESMWSIYNAIGAPDAPGGVNPSHGQESVYGITPNSLLPDPNTGLFSQAQIDQLQAHVTALTATGGRPTKRNNVATWSDSSGWGPATIERVLSTTRPAGDLRKALTLDIVGKTPEEQALAQEAIEKRLEINAWFAQHLSWFVQLAQMRRDESLPGQQGVDNKAHNSKLNTAMRSLLYMHADVRAVMMGVDAYVADNVANDTVLKTNLWRALQNGLGDRVVVLNRSAMIMHREPVRFYSDWTQDLVLTPSQYPGARSVIGDRNW